MLNAVKCLTTRYADSNVLNHVVSVTKDGFGFELYIVMLLPLIIIRLAKELYPLIDFYFSVLGNKVALFFQILV